MRPLLPPKPDQDHPATPDTDDYVSVTAFLMLHATEPDAPPDSGDAAPVARANSTLPDSAFTLGINRLPHTSRLRAILLHIPFYCCDGPARLAEDACISRATVSRLMAGRVNPSLATARAVTKALSLRRGIPIPTEEIFSVDGHFPTASTCELMDCDGCLPPEAWNERIDRLKPGWRDSRPGDWCRFPTRTATTQPSYFRE